MIIPGPSKKAPPYPAAIGIELQQAEIQIVILIPDEARYNQSLFVLCNR